MKDAPVGCGLDGGRTGILFLTVFTAASGLVLRPTQHLVQWVRLAVLLVAKRSQRETVRHLH